MDVISASWLLPPKVQGCRHSRQEKVQALFKWNCDGQTKTKHRKGQNAQPSSRRTQEEIQQTQ